MAVRMFTASVDFGKRSSLVKQPERAELHESLASPATAVGAMTYCHKELDREYTNKHILVGKMTTKMEGFNLKSRSEAKQFEESINGFGNRLAAD